VWISQPETGSRFVPGGVNFQMATPDGRHVVFTSKDPLLPVDTGGSGSGLYMYTDGPEPESESNLTFIGRVTALVGHESELVQGISDDGDYVYFLSGQATALFVWHDGEVHEVVPTNDVREEARVSPDGTRFVFSVPNGVYVRQTTNTEINLYDAKTETVKCISCPPNGETPISGVETDVTATSPSNPVFAVDVAPRFFSTDGKYVFFNTRESLVPQDTDGTTDAYEYDLETGKLSLLSSGTGETGTWFVEASADGRDAFLVTRQKLTGWDEDKLVDLYDARVEGGFPEPSPPLPPCLGDACQGTPSAAPTFNTASGFSGLGNLQVPQASKVSSKALTRSAALRKALRACGRRPKKARARCRARARKRYAAKSNAKRATRHAGR